MTCSSAYCFSSSVLLTCREFCNMVRRIFICSSQDVKKLSTGSKLPGSSTDGEGTVISSAEH
jgi:hypothetical protein